jgi:hypothetical protein
MYEDDPERALLLKSPLELMFGWCWGCIAMPACSDFTQPHSQLVIIVGKNIRNTTAAYVSKKSLEASDVGSGAPRTLQRVLQGERASSLCWVQSQNHKERMVVFRDTVRTKT